MLTKYYRFRIKWVADQTLTYNNGARVSLRFLPWKMSSGDLVYGTVITDDFGFVAGETIATGEEEEATVVINTVNLYWGGNGTIEVTADANSTGGTMYLYVEESDDNVVWPSDQADFDIDLDLILLCPLELSTDAVDEDRARNFQYGM